MKDYAAHDALGLAALVRRKEVSPLELVEAAIARIEAHNPALNAVIYKAYDQARAQASDPTGLPDGPFRGLPFLIKDILGAPIKDMPCTHGSAYFRDWVPDYDAEIVKRWKAAGLIVVGKTNVPEFAITGTTESAYLGRCGNPWNPDYSSGGSSGGAAAAVASGMVPIAHASDGLGSIRIPAAQCGLVGMKPTRDRNPHGPHDTERAVGFMQDHIVARTVRDCAAMLDVTGYPEPDAAYAWPAKEGRYLDCVGEDPGRLRIAFSDQRPNGKGADPEVKAVMEKTAKVLEGLGHHVEEALPQTDWTTIYQAQGAVSTANLAAGIAELTLRFGRPPEEHELEPLTWSGVKTGRKLTGDIVMWGWRTLRVLTREIMRFYETYDVFLCPTCVTPPPKLGYVDPVNLEPREVSKRQASVFGYTPPQNFTGQPSMSLPLGMSSGGLPIGMQFSARYADEATLYRLAGQLEQAMPWKDRTPPIWDL